MAKKATDQGGRFVCGAPSPPTKLQPHESHGPAGAAGRVLDSGGPAVSIPAAHPHAAGRKQGHRSNDPCGVDPTQLYGQTSRLVPP